MEISNLWTTWTRSLVHVPFVCAGYVEKSRSSRIPRFSDWSLWRIASVVFIKARVIVWVVSTIVSLSNQRPCLVQGLSFSEADTCEIIWRKGCKGFPPSSTSISFHLTVLCAPGHSWTVLRAASSLNLVPSRLWSSTFAVQFFKILNRPSCLFLRSSRWWWRRLWW